MAQIETDNFRTNLATVCRGHGEVQRIALDAGISRVFLSRIIHGKSTPSIDVAVRIAKALDVGLSELIMPPSKFSNFFSAEAQTPVDAA